MVFLIKVAVYQKWSIIYERLVFCIWIKFILVVFLFLLALFLLLFLLLNISFGLDLGPVECFRFIFCLSLFGTSIFMFPFLFSWFESLMITDNDEKRVILETSAEFPLFFSQ